MRKNIFIILAFLLTGLPSYSLALSSGPCFRWGICEEGYTILSPGRDCKTTDTTCYGQNGLMGVVNCKSCPENYELKTITTSEGLGCTVNKTICEYIGGTEPEPDCDALCEECLPPFQIVSWTPVDNNPGYKSRTTTICNEETNCECENHVTYGCADGYYGTNPSCPLIVNVGISCRGCTKCPSLGDVEGKTAWLLSSFSPGGGETITDCFISANTELKDSTGTYVFESKCNYKQ